MNKDNTELRIDETKGERFIEVTLYRNKELEKSALVSFKWDAYLLADEHFGCKQYKVVHNALD